MANEEFGKLAYTNTVYINFEFNSKMEALFTIDLEINRLATEIELYTGHKINPKNTLLMFDEVQAVPRTLTSLKYFYENAPQYHIICACSFLDIPLQHGTAFPVEKLII